MRITGIYKQIGNLEYFLPYNLPPKDPSFKITSEIMTLYGEASFALGQLNEMSLRVPDINRFIKAYVIKEAMLSSSIEGIHTTLIEVFTSPIEGYEQSKNTQLVMNYSKALEQSLEMIHKEGLPLVSRVILKAHEVLMNTGDGGKSSPGSYRKLQVRVGDLVPPAANEIANLINNLENYINDSSDLPDLIKAGLVHVQFETIHPFLDGNGRIGRLLIVLMLINSGLLKLPILYPSYYFKKFHYEYYQKLDVVRTKGDFEEWIIYYLKAIRDSANDAYYRAKEIEKLEYNLKQIIETNKDFYKMRETALKILEVLFMHPVITIVEMSKKVSMAYNSVSKIFELFIKNNILEEPKSGRRNKTYKFISYISLLEKEY